MKKKKLKNFVIIFIRSNYLNKTEIHVKNFWMFIRFQLRMTFLLHPEG